jgi:hypothetical protein
VILSGFVNPVKSIERGDVFKITLESMTIRKLGSL